jgi:Arc/MetJ family transcription regulator
MPCNAVSPRKRRKRRQPIVGTGTKSEDPREERDLVRRYWPREFSDIPEAAQEIYSRLDGNHCMKTRKTSLRIDVDLLEAVQEVLETRTLRETVERAFLEVLRAEARRQEVQELSSMSDLDLADPEVMAGAWRS